MSERAIVIDLIFDELRKAEAKFPSWPDDPVHGAAILAEEAGELVKASLDFYYGRHERIDEMEKEAAQVGAMAIRFLAALEGHRLHPQKGISREGNCKCLSE